MAGNMFFQVEIFCGKGNINDALNWREWERYPDLRTCRNRRRIILEAQPNADPTHVRVCRVVPLDLPDLEVATEKENG